MGFRKIARLFTLEEMLYVTAYHFVYDAIQKLVISPHFIIIYFQPQLQYSPFILGFPAVWPPGPMHITSSSAVDQLAALLYDIYLPSSQSHIRTLLMGSPTPQY